MGRGVQRGCSCCRLSAAACQLWVHQQLLTGPVSGATLPLQRGWCTGSSSTPALLPGLRPVAL
jgi:hypothetical protein